MRKKKKKKNIIKSKSKLPKVRKVWLIKPAVKVKPSRKAYSRKRKKEILKQLEEFEG